MEKITVKKTELLKVLKKNRAEHRKIYEEAVEGYRRLVIGEFTRRLDDAKQGRKIDTVLRVTEPRDQTKDYDRAIRMIEMDTSDVVSLNEEDFANYVMDDWGWMQNFLLSNSAYSATATKKMSER